MYDEMKREGEKYGFLAWLGAGETEMVALLLWCACAFLELLECSCIFGQ
jgi:hypothetical protein